DHRIGVLERLPRLAALQRARVEHVATVLELWRSVRDRLLEIGHVRERLVLDLDERERADRGLRVIGRDGRDLVADEADLVAEDGLLAAESGFRRVETMQD